MPKAKSKRQPSVAASTESTLALSSWHINLETLEKEHQWLIKQIKRKRTELNNFVNQLRSLATQIFHRTGSIVQNMMAIDKEIHQLFTEILADKKLARAARVQIENLYESLQIVGIISPESSSDEQDEDRDRELDDLFEEEEQKSSFPEQKNSQPKQIRQTFLKLAEIFHPDKVSDTETQMRHTEIMKEINRAYHENDLARLLEIEKQHLSGENIEGDNQDDLTRRCQLIEQENQLLRTQYENLKRELNMIKRTPEGSMVSDYRKAIKEDIDPIEILVKEADREREAMEGIRDFVKKFRDKKITLKEFLRGPTLSQKTSDEMLEDFLEELLGTRVTISRR